MITKDTFRKWAFIVVFAVIVIGGLGYVLT